MTTSPSLSRPTRFWLVFATLGALSFDPAVADAEVAGDGLRLAHRELLVLEMLMRRAEWVLMRAAVEKAVYGYDDQIASNILDAHISRLRQKLEAVGRAWAIL
ncbi:winged helix-turn-helix domain-containing protein [Brevundimonas sp.]|jgi:DNA-binding response OmpR family regulator|uniref:winged helix-turn-helix domain-containing protein n=1 Tax=Brevundimonas sp. TaxID=1871086 RepID=UPI003D131F4E